MTNPAVSRPIAGRLSYASQPQPGTIVGPKDVTREWLVVLGPDPDNPAKTLIGYATQAELNQAAGRMTKLGLPPRSLVERDTYRAFVAQGGPR